MAGRGAAEQRGAAELMEVLVEGGEEGAAGAAVLEVGVKDLLLGLAGQPARLLLKQRAPRQLAHLGAELLPLDRLKAQSHLPGRAQQSFFAAGRLISRC